MKTILVSQRIDHVADRGEIRDAIDHRVVQFILDCGFLPALVPNNLGPKLGDWLESTKPAGIMLSGGGDFGISSQRDETELFLLKYAEQLRLPLLGICRGMQVVGLSSGVSLKRVTAHVGGRHSLIGDIARSVNSYHNHALSECPKDFSVLARAADGVIEAIKHLELPWECWMWHPERDEETHIEDLNRAKKLFGQASC